MPMLNIAIAKPNKSEMLTAVTFFGLPCSDDSMIERGFYSKFAPGFDGAWHFNKKRSFSEQKKLKHNDLSGGVTSQ